MRWARNGGQLYLFWQHELASALLIHIIPPVVASAALIGSGKNFASIQRSRLGRYLERYMTPAAQLTRLFGDIVTVFAAWLHSLLGIVIGLLIVIGAWGYGLVFPAPFQWTTESTRCGDTAADGRQRTEVSLTRLELARQADLA